VVDRARGGTTTPPQKPWCCRTGGPASEPSFVPSRQYMYTFYSRGSDPASGSAASTVNRFYRRFDRLSSVKIADIDAPIGVKVFVRRRCAIGDSWWRFCRCVGVRVRVGR
jgi:hypothetical protein